MSPLSVLSKALRAGAVTAAVCLGAILPAQAGSIFLTGHDIDLHSGADGYDVAVLNYLRGAGTTSEIAAGSYSVGLIRSIDSINPAGGFVGGVLAGSWAGGVTQADPTQFATAAAFATFLSSIDVLVVASQVACGGCDFSPGDSTVLNTFSAEITSFFNAGGDVFGNTVANLATGFGYLPASVAAVGAPISGSSGFVVTAAGAAIGITDAMVNGDQTHNRFTTFDDDFSVFEVRPNASLPGGQEIISIGIRDAVIGDDGGVGICGLPGTPACAVPEPGTLPITALALVGLGWVMRRRVR